MFYIRAFDYITTLLIFRGSAGGQGALSRLTSGSQEPELQSGTWQWMSSNDLDGICYTARRKPISPGNLAVEKRQRFKNKPHLFQRGVMLPHQRSTSLEFPCRMMNNYTQMTTQQLWTRRPEMHSACSCLGNWVQEMQRMIWIVCLFTRCLSDFSTLLKGPLTAGACHRSLSGGLGEPFLQLGSKRALCAAI